MLPVIKPVPVAAAAGESLTASAPLPAVYGYTPEHHVHTKNKQFERKLKKKTRRQHEKNRKRGEMEKWRS